MSTMIVAIGTLSVVASLRYGDYSALRARIDARGSQEFAKQSQWIVNYPSGAFREKLQSLGSLPLTDSSYPPGSTKLLIPQTSQYLLPAKGAYTFKTTVAISPPPPGEDAYIVDMETEWETPTGAAKGSAVRTNKLEMRGVRKW